MIAKHCKDITNKDMQISELESNVGKLEVRPESLGMLKCR